MFKRGNEKRDKLIFDIIEEYKLDGYEWTWQDVANELEFRGKYDETSDACRKAYKRYCEKNKPIEISDTEMFEYHGAKSGSGSVQDIKGDLEYTTGGWTIKTPLGIHDISGVCGGGDGGQKLDKQKENITLERKKDGTLISERKVILSETDMKDDRCVLLAHGFDPDKYDVVSIKNRLSVWDNGNKEGTELQSYQSSLTVKPKNNNNELTKKDILELHKEFNYKHQPIYKIVDTPNGGHALFIEIGDLHLGLFSWGKETGENADYVIIETKFREVIAKIKKFILSHPEIDTVYLIFGGDIIHVDNEQNTTSGGTVMQFDGRAKKMVRISYKVLSWAILELSFVKHLFVKVLEGNHGRLTEFTIFEGLKNMFSEFENIDFDNSPMARKAVLYGGDLIGLSHGELSNKKNQNWLQVEFAELWGKSKRREIHLFHLHKEESEITEGGITIRRNPTIKPTDHYEYFNAFIGADKKIACYLYDEKEGLESINYFRSMFTR